MESMRDDTIDTSTSTTYAPQPSKERDASCELSQDDNVLENSEKSDTNWKPKDTDDESEIDSSEYDFEHADSSLDERPILESEQTQTDQSEDSCTEKLLSNTTSAGM